jgi:hypothetical protein
MKIFSLKNRYRASSVFALSLAFLLMVTATAYAALTLSATNITSDSNMTLSVASGGTVTVDGGVNGGRIVLGPTFTGSSSRQSVEADATLSSFTGGYGAAAMGNVGGTVAAGNSIVGGLIGKYNVATNPSDEPAGAVLAEIGESSAGTADGAFVAYIGGDSGAVSGHAAYTVRSLNSTSGSGFDYGVDLNSTTVTGYQPLTFGVADIRLNSAATIGSGTTAARPATCVKGSIYLNTTTGIMDGCTATNTWTAYDLTD